MPQFSDQPQPMRELFKSEKYVKCAANPPLKTTTRKEVTVKNTSSTPTVIQQKPKLFDSVLVLIHSACGLDELMRLGMPVGTLRTRVVCPQPWNNNCDYYNMNALEAYGSG